MNRTITASRLVLAGFLAATIGMTNYSSAQDLWQQSYGPYGGTVLALAASPDGSLFAGTRAGVFRSTNSGGSWAPVNTGLTNVDVWALGVDSSGTLYAGTSGGEMFRSTNNGGSWTAINNGMTGGSIRSIAINYDGIVYVGTTGGGVLRSTNQGENWTAINSGLVANNVWPLAIDDSGRLFARVGGVAIYRSTDHGETWTYSGLNGMDANRIAIDATGVILVGTNEGLFFRSTDHGETWTQTGGGLSGASVRSMTAISSGFFFAGTPGGSMYLSSDGGDHWTESSTGLPGSVLQSLAITPSGAVVAGAGGDGVFRSTDDGQHWTSANFGLTALPVQSLAVSLSDRVFAGTNGAGVFRSTDSGESWIAVNSGLTGKNVQALAMNSSGFVFVGTAGGGAFRSTDNGGSWMAINAGLTATDVQALLAKPPGLLFAGTYDGGIFRSTDDGISWTAANSGLASLHIWSLATGPSGHIFAGTDDGVFRSMDDGGSWVQVNSGLTGNWMFPLAISLSGDIFAGRWGIFRSTDDGGSWVPVTEGSQVGNVTALAVSSRGYVLSGTGVGVLRSADSGQNWVSVSSGLSSSGIWAFALDSAGFVFVGNGDGGVRRSLHQFIVASIPSLESPSNGSADQPTAVTLFWSASAGATSYRVQVSTDSGFSLPVVDLGDIADTTYTVVGFASGAAYYWRVAASNVWGPSAFSTVRKFTTKATDYSALLDGWGARLYPSAPRVTNPNVYRIGGKSITVEAWIYPIGFPNPAHSKPIVIRPLQPATPTALTHPPASYALQVYGIGESPHLGFSISSGSPGSTDSVFATEVLPMFQWTHVAGTYDGITLRLLVNGQVRAQAGSTLTITTLGSGLSLGGYGWGADGIQNAFQGAIDKVRLWTIARSPEQILGSMYTSEVDTTGLVGHWDMSPLVDNGRTYVRDLSKYANDLAFISRVGIVEFDPLTSYGAPTFSFSPSSFDFGIVEQGSLSTRSITIVNTSANPLIGVFVPSTNQTMMNGDDVFFVPPGQTLNRSVSLAPKTPGLISNVLELRTNAPSVAQIPVSVVSIALRRFDANSIGMWTLRDGRFACDVLTGLPTSSVLNPGLEWPKGSGKFPVYSSGLWIGAMVGGNPRTACAFYQSEFTPGPIINGVAANPNDTTYRVYRIRAGDNPGTNADYASWPSNLGAPINPDGSPRIIGDQTLFSVYNDLNTNPRYFGSQPLGAEVQQTIFGFNQSGALDKTVFLRFKVINKSNTVWNDAYIALWSDPDLGDSRDDLVGVDSSRSLAFVYNGTNTDPVYGTPPPAAAYNVLKGAFYAKPIQAFAYYTGGGGYPYADPTNQFQAYNFMKGRWADGSAFMNPTNGLSTNFALNGDPVTGSGWIDSSPADRRFLLSTGRFNLEPGQSKEMIAAIILGQGSTNLTSISDLRSEADSVKSLFESGQVFGGTLENVTSVTVPMGSADTLDDLAHSGATLAITSGPEGATVEIASYVGPPPGAQVVTTPSLAGVGKYLDVQVQGTVEWPVAIRIYYTANDLVQAGVVESDLMGVYYWSGLTNEWNLYSNSGSDDQGRGPSATCVDTSNVLVNGVSYEGFVAASAYHLTPITIGAKKSTMKDRYTEAIKYVMTLPDNAFKKPANVRRLAIAAELSASYLLQTCGKLKSAAQKIAGSVLNHLTPQGNSAENLWVRDSAACAELVGMVTDIIDLLSRPASEDKMALGEMSAQSMTELPTEFGLAQNFPNPFNPSTTIRYQLPKSGQVSLKVYNMLGEEVATIVSQFQEPGFYQVTWDPKLPSGVYLYRLQAGEFVETRKLILLK